MRWDLRWDLCLGLRWDLRWDLRKHCYFTWIMRWDFSWEMHWDLRWDFEDCVGILTGLRQPGSGHISSQVCENLRNLCED